MFFGILGLMLTAQFLGKVLFRNNPFMTDQEIIILFLICLPVIVLFFLRYLSWNALTETERSDLKQREFTVSIPYEDAFQLCIQSLQEYPFAGEPTSSPARGTIFMEHEDIRFSLYIRRVNSRKTAIITTATDMVTGNDRSDESQTREMIRGLDRIREFCEKNQPDSNRTL